MRLGDLDALKEEIVKLCEHINANKGIAVPTLAFTRIIDNAPTVEEVSVIEFKEPLPPVKAQKIIRALEKRPQGEWIPVSERLPEQNGYYITTCRDICENRVHTVGFDGVRKKWGRGGVIAWQSLPKPYKQD